VSRGGSGPARAILLDFGGTLDADGVHWCPRFHAAYRRLGGALDYQAFEALFKTSEAMLAELPDVRTLGFRAAIEAQVRLLVGLLPRAAAVRGEPFALALHDEALAMVRRNRPVLERLAARYRLGVVSNFTGNLEPCLAELELLSLFAAVLDSGVLGIAKPDERIFTRALAGVGVRAEEAWMVGDNLEADIRPAHRLGLRTCWLTPPDRVGPADFAPTARIARLTELERAVA
jgi:putative hydrolase of the HAD superfamily